MTSHSNLSVGEKSSGLSEEEYHRDVAMVMTPGMAILGLLMLIGLFGNILVLYVYIFKLKRSASNVFITALAVFDIVVCSVCIPMEIVTMSYLYSFDKPWLCRIVRYIVHFCVLCSVGVLIAIAVVRYKRICTPFAKQITIKTAKIAVAIVCVVSSSVAAPAMAIYGRKTVNRSFTGHACETDDGMIATPYPSLFNGMQFFIAVVTTTTLTVLYSLILMKVRAHERHKNRRKRTKQIRHAAVVDNDKFGKKEEKANTKPKSIDVSLVISTAWNRPSTRETTNEEASQSDNITDSIDDESIIGDGVTSSPHKSIDVKSMSVSNYSDLKPKRFHKTTFMMFMITAVFVVSFFPHLGLMATRAIQKHTFEHLEGVSLGVYHIFLRIYFISSASNPIIYSFLSDKFRREVNVLFKRPTPQPAAV